ncbi:MAG: hypothetical protein MJZ37_00025 [Bacilli bacterium]|nr:hypothetical protein [Bacilli bacterium]
MKALKLSSGNVSKKGSFAKEPRKITLKNKRFANHRAGKHSHGYTLP